MKMGPLKSRLKKLFVVLFTFGLVSFGLYAVYIGRETSIPGSASAVTARQLGKHDAKRDRLLGLTSIRPASPAHLSINQSLEQGAISSRIAERVQTLQAQCHSQLNEEKFSRDWNALDYRNIIVNDEYQIMYCYIPKVACTNLKRVFLLLSGHMNTTNPLEIHPNDVHFRFTKYLTFLDSYNDKEIMQRIDTYKKVIFVREPLERMLSAYRNKFTQNSPYFHSRFGRTIVKRFRKGVNDTAEVRGDDVTFLEFVQYLLDPWTLKEGNYNAHWERFTHLCHPCQIKYDFVGRYETLDEEVNYLLQLMKVDDFISFPKRSDTYKRLKTEDVSMKFYSQLPVSVLSKLWQVYSLDYRLFDYPFPDVISQLQRNKKYKKGVM